ncbi:MAG: hypothetical protein M3Y38_03370, partial [Actinomycetota bacterium]|nr:hypothetical protein [Actinomycetota bacterium]
MGRAGSAVEIPERGDNAPPGYESLDGNIPVLHAPRLEAKAWEIGEYLQEGYETLSRVLSAETPE